MCALCTKKDRKKEREKKKWERKTDRHTQVLCMSSGSDVHQSKRVKEKKKCKTRSREYGEGRHNPRKSNPKK
ncbi:hypothetical protein RUM43_013613, partial [Polyplax serrata]